MPRHTDGLKMTNLQQGRPLRGASPGRAHLAPGLPVVCVTSAVVEEVHDGLCNASRLDDPIS